MCKIIFNEIDVISLCNRRIWVLPSLVIICLTVVNPEEAYSLSENLENKLLLKKLGYILTEFIVRMNDFNVYIV